MNSPHQDWLMPDWPAPRQVRALMTTRAGGVSSGAFGSMNLGKRSGDALENIARNREILHSVTGREIRWLRQVHSAVVVNAVETLADDPPADASYTCGANIALAAMAADCLPVLFCSKDGRVIAAAHAGWRGLSAGVLQNTVAAMQRDPHNLLAWMGAAIGPAAFEVGQDVYDALCTRDVGAQSAFVSHERIAGKYFCDLFALARAKLCAAGIASADIYGGGLCTYRDPTRFFSYRREPVSGRMAALIWKTSD